MARAQELQLLVIESQGQSLVKDEAVITQPTLVTPRRGYQWWIKMAVYIFFVLSGQTLATLLGRLYYNKGGNSKWIQSIVVTSGFPFLLPILFYFSYKPCVPNHTTSSNNRSPSTLTLVLLYTFFGVLNAGYNLLYAYGLLYLPVSTYSLVCATQLAFNALFSYFINSLNFTPIVLNSVILVTISATLLALHSESDGSNGVTKAQYAIGFVCTVSASALFSLSLSLTEISFEKVLRRKTLATILKMDIYPGIIATFACLVGLFASREWWSLKGEMKEIGGVPYVMIIVWTSVGWSIFNIGALGLIIEVSSLFTNVISTVALPIVPIFGVMFFHDKMDGVKVVALILAIWGFISYMYQNYLDDLKLKASRREANNENFASEDLFENEESTLLLSASTAIST